MSNQPNLIKLEELQQFKETHRILYASDSNQSKRLFLYLNNSMAVEVDGEIVWRGMQPYAAVEAFNKNYETI